VKILDYYQDARYARENYNALVHYTDYVVLSSFLLPAYGIKMFRD